jgi:hypothetical protein
LENSVSLALGHPVLSKSVLEIEIGQYVPRYSYFLIAKPAKKQKSKKSKIFKTLFSLFSLFSLFYKNQPKNMKNLKI